MADEKIVKQKLRTLLKEVDFETATQRSITQKLEEELEVNLSQHKPMIKVRMRRDAATAHPPPRCTAAALLPARTSACAVLTEQSVTVSLPSIIHCRRRLICSWRSSRMRQMTRTTTSRRRQRRSPAPPSGSAPRAAPRRPLPLPATAWWPCRPSASPACASMAGG